MDGLCGARLVAANVDVVRAALEATCGDAAALEAAWERLTRLAGQPARPPSREDATLAAPALVDDGTERPQGSPTL